MQNYIIGWGNIPKKKVMIKENNKKEVIKSENKNI